MHEHKNVNDVVVNNLCIGCLCCINLCPYSVLEINTHDYPFPTPILFEQCDNCGICLLECPGANEIYD